MAVNKVIINNDTVVDLTDTTAEADTVLNGEVFYTASGSRAVGTYVDHDTTDLTKMTGILAETHGGTGQTSLQATRNAMGLGNTIGALSIANGGTGATTASGARAAFGLPETFLVQEITTAGTYTITCRANYVPAFIYGINASWRYAAIIQPGGGNPSIDKVFGEGPLPTVAAGTSANQIKITFTTGVDTIVIGPISSITTS